MDHGWADDTENLHVFQRWLDIAIVWDVIDGVSVIQPVVKGQIIHIFIF